MGVVRGSVSVALAVVRAQQRRTSETEEVGASWRRPISADDGTVLHPGDALRTRPLHDTREWRNPCPCHYQIQEKLYFLSSGGQWFGLD